jgi:multiple sugar transport system substrate-binding protein
MMSAENKMFNWILTILLIIVLIVSGIGVYYSSAMLGKLDELSTDQNQNYTSLSDAISSSNATSADLLEALLEIINSLNEAVAALNITLPLVVIGSATPTSGVVPLTVSFKAVPIGGTPPYSFEWDFGDQTPTSSERTPAHNYTMAGTYTATITVTDSTGVDASDTVTVKSTPAVPVTLTVFSLWSGSEEANFKQVLERFTNLTGISVRHIGYSTEELLITVPTQLRAGISIADVIIAPWPSWILNLAGEGYLTTVSDLINTTKFPQPYLDLVTSQGEIWAAPFKASGKPGFWYRKSFFANNSLTVPTNYTEFKDLLATIQGIPGVVAPIASGNGVGWPLSDTTEAFIIGLGEGGYQLQLDLIFGDEKFNSTVVKDVFVELASLLQAGYFSVPDDFDAQVAKVWDGTYAMYFQGSFITAFEPFASNLEDVGFFPFPETTGATGAIDYAIIPWLTEHPIEAGQLLGFLASAEAQEIMVGLGGFLAPNIDVPDSAYSPIDLTVLQFLRTVTVVPDLDDAIGPPFQTTFWDQLKAFWVNPTMDIDTMLQTLQDDWSAPPF